MDYNSLTKKELIEKVKEQKHLKETLEVKDKELSEYKKANEEKTKKLKEYRHIVDTVEAKNKEVVDLKASSKKNLEDLEKDLTSKYKKIINALEKVNKRRVGELNSVILNYGALLKTLQGTLDTHIELNEMVLENIKREE